LGRVTLIPYYPLADEVMRKIVKLQLDRVQRRVHSQYNASFDYSDDVITAIAERCMEVQTGARNVDHMIHGRLLPELSAKLLGRMAEGEGVSKVSVSVDGEGSFAYELVS